MGTLEMPKPAFNIPDIREYFIDLDYVLGVISDGPTKSFAFRRLKYLQSKFTMYSMLNEFQELADMKVRVYLFLCARNFSEFRW
jgi:AMP deaminase